ncbi:amino acid permease/ SLC12A domain-containing protein [Rhodocollybia butyracea]|uniref:Amino acid permease/ SLC12A domain-containing protein n=1 Tax=Rhodocollybia butyracea TaxID=206335 RepID=A0A9P5U4C7_9AGAR|nr:amino acid permease/ SLC12A domain-containing protein [Rhodocollybia butyracea]
MSFIDEKDRNMFDVHVGTIKPVIGTIEEEEVFEEEKDLKRGLHQRHVQMIAIAGTIGTGLFLGSGEALASAGPVGTILGYLLTGILVSGVVISIAELAALVPLTGSYIRHAEYFVDPALSFAAGWNNVYLTVVSIPAEVVASAVLVSFWTTSVSNGVWITIMGLLIIVTSLCFVRIYGELEFGFAMLKIALIVGLIIMGLCIDLGGVAGQPRLGFQYWRNPGPFVQYLDIPGATGRFLGFWTVFSNAAYAYSSIETMASAAAETKNPRRNLPKAAKRIFIRVLLFYVISIFIVTLIVPSNNKLLLRSTGNASQSPFVIVATSAGIKVVPHIVNAIVLTSAWSSGNSTMLTGSRILYGLAREGHAPKIFLRTNRFGIPYLCVLFIGVFIALGYMTLQSSASMVFGWFQELVAAGTLVTWIVICVVYLRFYYGCKRQGIDRSELPWAAPFQPYAAWAALFGFGLILLTGGFAVFMRGHWDIEKFFGSYFNVPFILIIYFGYKITKKTKIVSLDDMPIRFYIDIANQNPETPEPQAKGWRRINILWS